MLNISTIFLLIEANTSCKWKWNKSEKKQPNIQVHEAFSFRTLSNFVMEIRQFLVVASVAASTISSILVVALFCYLCKRKLFPILKQRFKKKGQWLFVLQILCEFFLLINLSSELGKWWLGSLKFENILLRRFQLVEQEKATNNFSQDCLLGSGAFGNVYKGDFNVEGKLAIKRPLADSYQSVEEFRNVSWVSIHTYLFKNIRKSFNFFHPRKLRHMIIVFGENNA